MIICQLQHHHAMQLKLAWGIKIAIIKIVLLWFGFLYLMFLQCSCSSGTFLCYGGYLARLCRRYPNLWFSNTMVIKFGFWYPSPTSPKSQIKIYKWGAAFSCVSCWGWVRSNLIFWYPSPTSAYHLLFTHQAQVLLIFSIFMLCFRIESCLQKFFKISVVLNV